MLCIQNISNLYRKNAFKCLHNNTQYFIDGVEAKADNEAVALTNIQSEASEHDDAAKAAFIAALSRDASLTVFDEPIDFSLEAGVPDPIPFEQKLRSMLEDNDAFLLKEQQEIGARSVMAFIWTSNSTRV